MVVIPHRNNTTNNPITMRYQILTNLTVPQTRSSDQLGNTERAFQGLKTLFFSRSLSSFELTSILILFEFLLLITIFLYQRRMDKRRRIIEHQADEITRYASTLQQVKALRQFGHITRILADRKLFLSTLIVTQTPSVWALSLSDNFHTTIFSPKILFSIITFLFITIFFQNEITILKGYFLIVFPINFVVCSGLLKYNPKFVTSFTISNVLANSSIERIMWMIIILLNLISVIFVIFLIFAATHQSHPTTLRCIEKWNAFTDRAALRLVTFLGYRRLEAQSGFEKIKGLNFTKFSNIINLLTHSVGFYRDVRYAKKEKSYGSLAFAVWRFASCFYKPAEIVEIFKVLFDGLDFNGISPIEVQASSTFRDHFENWKTLSDSDISTKINKVFVGLMTCALTQQFKIGFTKHGLSKYFATYDPKIKTTSPLALITSCIELCLTFSEVGYECFVDKSLQPVLIQDRALRNWVDEYAKIKTVMDRRPTDENFDPNAILDVIGKLVLRANHISRRHGRTIDPLYRELLNFRSSIIKEYNIASFRKPPFSVLVHGPPGIGKSTVTKIIGTVYHRTVVEKVFPELEWDPRKNMYTYNPDDQFWSGYKGAQQWFIVMDDLAREHKSHVAKGLGTSLADVITLVNTVGIATNQAALEDKGMIPLIPKLVVATTNVKDLNAVHGVAEKAAVLRRFPYVVRPFVKDEFLDKESGMMKKLSTITYDAWEYQVEYVKQTVTEYETGDAQVRVDYVAVPGSAANQRMTGAEFSMFLKGKILEHEENAAVMYDSLAVDDNITMCKHGTLSHFPCPQCLEVQAWFRRETKWERVTKYIMKQLIDITPLPIFVQMARWNISTRALLIRKIKRFETVTIGDNVARIALYSACNIIVSYYLTSFFINFFFPEKVETQSNFWATYKTNDDFVVPKTSHANNLDEIQNTLRKSMFRLAIRSDGARQEVSCFALKNGWYVTVQHPFSGDSWQCVARYKTKKHSLDASNAFTLTEANLVRLPNDLVMFWSLNLLPRKGIYDFLPKSIDKRGRKIKIFDPRLDFLDEGLTTSYHKLVYTDDYKRTITGTFMDGNKHSNLSVKGDCGAIAIAESINGYFISGLHCAGSAGGGTRIIFTQLSQEIFDGHTPPIVTLTDPDIPRYIQGSSKSGKLGPCGPKGLHNWCEGHAVPLGSYPSRSTHSSHTVRSIICDEVEEAFDMKIPYTAPLMNAIKEDGEWKNPFAVATRQLSTSIPHFKDEDVLLVKDAYVKDLLKTTEWLADVGTVDISIAVNGIVGDTYINRIPMNTSGGFYFPGNKRKYFKEVWINEELFQTPDQDIVDMVNSIELNYLNGERAFPVFQGSLKDEPVSYAKREQGKTRVFTACDVAFTIVVRKQFIKISKAFMINNFITESAVSMNCYSEAWERVFEYLTEHGEDRVGAGDHRSFDKDMTSAWVLAAFDVLITLRKEVGQLSSKDELICRGIATDIAFPVVNMNADLIQFFGSNPSGQPLTIIVNGIINSFYMRFAYHKADFPLSTFKKNVNLLTVGDDNIFNSKLDDFNHTVIAKILGNYGLQYTMADKESESVPFISIYDADFLKRTFRHLEGTVVAPLALDSIFKSLCMIVRKGNISDEEQLAQSYSAARREWSLHGKEVFERNCSKMDSIFSKHDNITRFFERYHSLSYEDTIKWVLNREDSE